MAKPHASLRAQVFGTAAIFLTKLEVSAHMMTPKMPKESANSMTIPNPKVPQMQNLRQGGGSMKVFGDNQTPKMQGLRDGGHNGMKK
jgi:hypothetical protein